jgi:hypothetical protein
MKLPVKLENQNWNQFPFEKKNQRIETKPKQNP